MRHVGAYAIQAFSGQASLDITTLHTVVQDAPLRILPLGPVNAGKSSLLNAMFSQQRSRRDVLPCPGVKGEHVLDRDDAPRAIVLDSDGFGGAGDESARRRLFEAIEAVDLIVAVTSARQAARKLECETLEEARRRFSASTRRACPPIIVAATHIDELRPAREWAPPYDFVDGDSPKEHSVRDAIEAISRDFQVSLDRVIPTCLAESAAYNVDEALMPVLAAAIDRPGVQKGLLPGSMGLNELIGAGVDALTATAAWSDGASEGPQGGAARSGRPFRCTRPAAVADCNN